MHTKYYFFCELLTLITGCGIYINIMSSCILSHGRAVVYIMLCGLLVNPLFTLSHVTFIPGYGYPGLFRTGRTKTI